MSEGGRQERLAAILVADMAEFSRLMTADEHATISALDGARAVFAACVASRSGRVVDMAGDSVLAVFPAAAGALDAALAVQARLNADADEAPAERCVRYRIGVHVGDVIEKSDGTVYGDGVNIAARLQALADPGGVCVSDAVRGAVRHRVAALFEDLGEKQVKNIAQAVRVFRVAPVAGAPPSRDRGAPPSASNVYCFGPFEVRPAQHLVLRDGRAVAVGARAFDVLVTLIERRPRLVTKRGLLDCAWSGLAVDEANVQAQVSTLRKALGSDVIATVPGLGYRFSAALDIDAGVTNARQNPPHAAERPESAAKSPIARRASNVPAALDALIGRDAEVSHLRQTLRSSRLVTILGPGGIGKTRLALEVARHEVNQFSDGVCWVDLAAVTSARNIAVAIANATNTNVGHDGTDAMERVVLDLQPRRMLLVLDNCEHVARDVSAFIQVAQSRAPELHILVTSQEALKISGGVTHRLGPLQCPRRGSSLDEARAAGAMQLLEQRTTAVDGRFELRASNIEVAIELVNRLDGMPLAIEMAAARVPSLGLEMLKAKLDERFELLRTAVRTPLARHQTLLATLEWSNSLLGTLEKSVLRRLSAFVGSFRVDIAQLAVREDFPDEWAVLDAMEGLVDKSLVQVESLEPPRYRLLETVRVFCAGQLQQHGDATEALIRHGQAMVTLAEEVENRYWQMPDAAWLDCYSRDYDDLQVAFDRACGRNDVACAAMTGCALMRLDHLRNLNAPRQFRAAVLHGLLPLADPLSAARIWACIAAHGLLALDVVSRLEAARQAVDAWRAQGDVMRLHFALGFCAAESARVHDFVTADRLIVEARSLEDPAWPLRRLMWGASAKAGVCIHQGDASGYREASREELSFAERAGADRAAAWARLKLADAALMAGDCPEAIALGAAAVKTLRELDQPSNLGLALTNLCAALLVSDLPRDARIAAIEAMPLMWRNGWAYLLLDSVALIAAVDGMFEAAAKLLGYVDAWYDRHQDKRQPNEAALRERTLAALSSTRSAEVVAADTRAGRALAEAQAERLAHSVLGVSGPS